jgi:glycosyltransferase involved in cell wall biosynthesis
MDASKNTGNGKPRVVMFGPDLSATSGISNVVNNWLQGGIADMVALTYISTLKEYVPGRFFRKIFEALNAYARMIALPGRDYDIVHIHFSSGMSFYRKLVLFFIARIKRKKIVVHLHASSFKSFYNDARWPAKRLIECFFNGSDMVLVLSESWRAFCREFCDPGKMRIVYNGAIIKERVEKKNGRIVNIACMGRLGERKGTYDLLKAFERLLEKTSDVRLVLGGDGDVDIVRKIVGDKGMGENVAVLGWVSGAQKDKVFNDADVYVLPSYNEGLPGSVLEAMAAGCPVVSTYVGGIPEVVGNGVNGYLIQPGDIDALYEKIYALASERKTREGMGARSREIVEEKFDIRRIVKDLAGAYHQILAR